MSDSWTEPELAVLRGRPIVGRVKLIGETIGERTSAPADDMSGLFEWCWARLHNGKPCK